MNGVLKILGMQVDEDKARRAIKMVDEIYEQGFRRRAEEATVEARRLRCGFTVTQSHGGFSTAQIVADPNVPVNTAYVHWGPKREGQIVTWRPGQDPW